MKHYLLFSCFAATTFVGFSQAEMPEEKKLFQEPGRTGIISSDRMLPFWEEDFAGGFPSDWAIIDSSGICPWAYSTDGSKGYYNTAGTGVGDPPLASTTAANGFLICDNDSANHFTYGQPSGTNYQYLASYFGTSVIDCSSHSSVILRFEHSYRYNNSVPMYVQVSTDSVNWTGFNVSGGLANNSASADPDIEVVNLSTIAGNQPTVYLRFGWNARVYFWMIDDISLSEADPNDVAIEKGYWGTGTFQYQYHRIPLSQDPVLTFYGPLTNNTGVTMNNAYFDVAVSNGSVVFAGTSNQMNLAATELDTAISTTDWTPSAAGNYEVSYEAFVSGFTDGNLTNNNAADSVEITSSLYGMDNLALNGAGYQGGIANWSGNSGLPFGIGNIYEVVVDDEIECMQIGITSNANNEGNLIYGAIYYYDGTQWAYLGATDDHTVAAGEAGTVISLYFDTPVPVTAGQELAVLACHYGGTDVEFMMAQSVPAGMVYGFDGAGDWYYLNAPKAVVCRADFACGLSVGEMDQVASISCYPNPAREVLNVSLDLLETSEVEIHLLDMNGKVIALTPPAVMSEGKTAAVFPVGALANGIYTVRIRINDKVIFEKIAVQ
jgi:hypothetical protein